MGGEQASMVLGQVRRDNIEAKGGTWSAAERRVPRADRAQYEAGNPYYATARLWDDGVMIPPTPGWCSASGFRRQPMRRPSGRPAGLFGM
jgi:acetyl-CoA carboxylase carboxyltransferase component